MTALATTRAGGHERVCGVMASPPRVGSPNDASDSTLAVPQASAPRPCRWYDEGKRQRRDPRLDGVAPRRSAVFVEPRDLPLEVAAAEPGVVLELLGHRPQPLAHHRPAFIAQEVAEVTGQRDRRDLGARVEVGTGE